LKLKHVFGLTFLVLLADQLLKFYVKTHFYLGEEREVIHGVSWFRLHFIENEGMAYGWKLGGEWGKLILTLFRLFAVVFGTYYLSVIIKKKFHTGFIICATLIYAGAIGNLIDSLFYGLSFEYSDPYTQNIANMFMHSGFKGGYAGFLHGRVVDMLYFPIITEAHFPSWFPIWGGESFEFFRPVFNIADASISLGVFLILLQQRKFFEKHQTEQHTTVETSSNVNDEMQVS
jgi:signal peptidase II